MAHSLSSATITAASPEFMKHDDIEWLLKRSMKIAEWMSLGIDGSGTNWPQALKQADNVFGYLWDGVTIKVVR